MKWGWDDGKVRRVVGSSNRLRNQRTSIGRESCKCGWCQTHYIKRKEKKKKMKFNFTVYGDEYKQEINMDHCTNPIAMRILGWVMLNPLLLQCYLITCHGCIHFHYYKGVKHIILVNIIYIIMFFMIFLHSSFHSTHIFNLHLFSVNLVRK